MCKYYFLNYAFVDRNISLALIDALWCKNRITWIILTLNG